MILFSSALRQHQLRFTPLEDCLEHLTLAATWTEEAWGYIRNKGVDERKIIMEEYKQQIYIAILGKQPVAMFALFPHEFHPDLISGSKRLPHTLQLSHVYVDKNYRGLGFGLQIINEAKRIAKASGYDLIVLDTLRPGLSKMYEKQGATEVCEGRLFGEPTEIMNMSI
jgi:diamine N-acetyltransferase